MIANKVFAKIGFYLLSMVFFLIIVMILGTDIPVYFGKDAQFVGLKNIFKIGIIIPVACGLLLLYAGGFACWLKHESKGTRLGPITITEISNVNSEIMSFVAAYFFPLVGFNYSTTWKHVVVLAGLFVLIGAIYIKGDIYYCNPTLSILGYRTYKIKGTTTTGTPFEQTVITSHKMSVEDKFTYITIDSNTCFAYKQ
ncbi:anti-phage protein KwaA [Marseilla massiliensis]|uniref:anti-phage protein KwaA n=1 Tax=Marseilla massiliensis TaxID=1841864 RepID=UPI0030C7FCA9